MLGLVDRLADAAGADVAWDARAAWTRRLLQDLLGGPSHSQSWDAPEARAAERIDLALDRLAALAEVEGPVELAVFNRTLQLELEGDLGRVGRFGEGVFVGPIGMAVGLDLEHLVIVGLAEGSFPATVQDDSLLPDRERDLLGGLLPLRSGRVDRSHRELLAAIASAQRQLLCVPRGDLRRSVERVPCRWLLDVAGQLAATGERLWSPDLLRVPTEPDGWLRHIRSFDDGLRQLDEPATEQEHRLRRLLASSTGRSGLLADDDAVIAAGALVVASRRSAQFTRFDGDVSSVSLRSPVEEIMSPTGLERWARCPQAYFQQRVLGVREVEHPEDSLRITAMDWGSLVHSALEGFLDQVLAEGPPPPDQAWTLLDRRRIIDIAEGLFAEYEQQGLTGRAIF